MDIYVRTMRKEQGIKRTTGEHQLHTLHTYLHDTKDLQLVDTGVQGTKVLAP
jgi:hypothetical protein